jgi:hypothetical protein
VPEVSAVRRNFRTQFQAGVVGREMDAHARKYRRNTFRVVAGTRELLGLPSGFTDAPALAHPS